MTTTNNDINFFGAWVCFNGEPEIVETDEQNDECIAIANESAQACYTSEDGYEFEELCAALNLDAKANKVTEIHVFTPQDPNWKMTVCFDCDWDYKE